MITDSFDNVTSPVIEPKSFYGEPKHICDICIVTFSYQIFDEIIKSFNCEKIAEIIACNGITPIYVFEYNNRKIAVYLSAIGASLAGTYVIEANHFTGATKFIMFGSAGCLDSAACEGKYVIPTQAYRDEGMSYHYAPPSDYIDIAYSQRTAQIFDEIKAPYVCGRVWTTDAIYRETSGLINMRKNEGCLAVEMELAGVEAVCSFHGFELYDFLITGDVLDSCEYDASELPKANHSLKNFYIALEIAKRI